MKLRAIFSSILNSYSGIIFTQSLPIGAFLLIITLTNPNIGLSGLICVLAAYMFARFLGLKGEFLRLDFYIYNPLLIGLGVGYLFKLGFLTFILLVVLGILTFVATYSMSAIFYRYFGLSVLSLPFVLISFVVYLASSKYSNLFVSYLYPNRPPVLVSLPMPIEGYLRALGAVFFMPDAFFGLLIFIALLLSSRILTFLSLLGYLTGSLLTALLTGSLSGAFSDLSSFNYILISMAVGGVFLIPSPRSYLLALLASAVAVPVVEATKVFWQAYGIPIFALPFNLITMAFVYSLGVAGYSFLTGYYKGTPEKTLDYYLTVWKRFPFWGREIFAPFSGTWTVWQSFDGKWTHRGAWKHALDFVITDENGRTFRGSGERLDDYYAYRKPVLSPVKGRVVEVVSNLPDNPVGSADREHNWGNYVLIYDFRGFYVLVAHLMQNSIKVKSGDYVDVGSMLGLCGNSGYSPQPHIHVHAQLSPVVGSPTTPFALSSFVKDDEFFDAGVPKEGDKIKPVYPDKSLTLRLNMLIDMRFSFEFNGKPRHAEVKMSPDGTFYLADGASKLYFGMKNGAFYFYSFEGDPSSFLRYIFLAAPKIPLSLSKGLEWRDFLPLEVFEGSVLKKSILRFLSSFCHRLFQLEGVYTFDGSRIKGQVSFGKKKMFTELEIDREVGFFYVFVRDGKKTYVLRRLEDEKVFAAS